MAICRFFQQVWEGLPLCRSFECSTHTGGEKKSGGGMRCVAMAEAAAGWIDGLSATSFIWKCFRTEEEQPRHASSVNVA